MSLRNGLRSYWDGRGTNMVVHALVQHPDFRAALDISDEQYEYMRNITLNLGRMLSGHPEYREIVQEKMAMLIDPFAQDVDFDEETLGRYFSLQERMSVLQMNVMHDAIDDALTPEQWQKVGESLLSMMGTMPIVSPRLFEVLNLTDAQREQMEEIKKELEPEFERQLEDYVRNQMFLQNRHRNELERQDNLNNANNAERQARSQAIWERLSDDPEFRRASEEIRTRGKAFAVQFKTKMFDVLTDAQWERLLYLVDNPPHLVGTNREIPEEQRRERDVWVPGPDSWRPGMPIPESYRIQRNTERRFPRPTNQ